MAGLRGAGRQDGGRAARIVLDERAFALLVRGRPAELVAHDGTQVAVLLADIGLARLANLLLAAIDAAQAVLTPTCRVCGCSDVRACSCSAGEDNA